MYTYASCEVPRSTKNASLFRKTMANYICSSYFAGSLQSKSFLYYILHKTSRAWDKNLWHQQEGSINRDWKELNTETYVYMFTKQRKSLLLHANTN